MAAPPTSSPDATTLERTYEARAELVWELLTTAAGLEAWWAPDGFGTRVTELNPTAGGQVRYTMTATGPEQVEFVTKLGLPLSSDFQRTFTEVVPPTRLAYVSVIDFIPGQAPYEHLSAIDLLPAGRDTKLVMTLDPLHDEAWTQEYRDHRSHELDKLEAAIRRRAS
jgi:uncharacterized protein YndB with AHSA1/START domain